MLCYYVTSSFCDYNKGKSKVSTVIASFVETGCYLISNPFWPSCFCCELKRCLCCGCSKNCCIISLIQSSLHLDDVKEERLADIQTEQFTFNLGIRSFDYSNYFLLQLHIKDLYLSNCKKGNMKSNCQFVFLWFLNLVCSLCSDLNINPKTASSCFCLHQAPLHYSFLPSEGEMFAEMFCSICRSIKKSTVYFCQ